MNETNWGISDGEEIEAYVMHGTAQTQVFLQIYNSCASTNKDTSVIVLTKISNSIRQQRKDGHSNKQHNTKNNFIEGYPSVIESSNPRSQSHLTLYLHGRTIPKKKF